MTGPGSKTILVFELADGRAFAFAAESAATAEVVVRAPWFTQALNRFCDARASSAMNAPFYRAKRLRVRKPPVSTISTSFLKRSAAFCSSAWACPESLHPS